MENTIKKLTKEELRNLTKEQLEELQLSYDNVLTEINNKRKQHSEYLQTIVNDWLNQFNIKCTVQWFYVENHLWSYELDEHPNSTYKIGFDVKLLDENNEVKNWNEFKLKIYDNELSGSISAVSELNKNKDIYDYYIYILFAKVLENDDELCKLINDNIDKELLESDNELKECANNINAQINRIEREENLKQYENNKAKALEQLKNAKFYKYYDKRIKFSSEKTYIIDKVSYKTVTMTEILIHGWNEKGYSTYGTHRFKLDEIFREMIIDETGFTLDSIDDEIDAARKEREMFK